jgi:hypothetical protein
MSQKFLKYNFNEVDNSSNLHKYIDKYNSLVLYIFKSSWEKYYICVEEWGDEEKSELKCLTVKDINKIYGINNFLRKEKINEINESSL